MAAELTGRCLCGAVSYRCSAEPLMAGHCQCHDCRRSSGSAHCTHVAVPVAALSLTGPVARFVREADSGNIVSREFCPTCGCAILSRNDGFPELAFLRASSLDDPDRIVPSMVVYASRGPAWDFLDPDLPSFPTMPPAAPVEA